MSETSETSSRALIDLFPTWEQVTNLIDTLAWPLVALIIIVMLRDPIKALLPNVEKFKYKDVEIKFREGLNQVRKEAQEAQIEVQAEVGEDSEFYKLVEASPSSAIFKSWKDLEATARKKVELLAPNETSYKNPLQRPIDYLEYMGALKPSTVRAIRELRELRNQVAHFSNIRISKADAFEYDALSKAMCGQVEAVTELPMMKLTALTLLVMKLNHLIDSNKYGGITIEDAHQAIKQKNIIPYLTDTTKGDSDFSVYGTEGPYANSVDNYHEQMLRIYEGYAGNERRKWGVENSGLCLLLAWTTQIIQQGAGWYPDEY